MHWFSEVRGASAVLAGCRCLTDALEVCFSACNLSFFDPRLHSWQLQFRIVGFGVWGEPEGQQEMTLTSSTDLVG